MILLYLFLKCGLGTKAHPDSLAVEMKEKPEEVKYTINLSFIHGHANVSH